METIFPVAATTFVTVLVYWLAERYVELVVRRIHSRVRFVRVVLRHGCPLVEASFAPLAVLLIAALLGASVSLAVDLALLLTTCLLVFLGWSGGRGSGLTGVKLLVAAAFSGLLGAIMVVLKLWLH